MPWVIGGGTLPLDPDSVLEENPAVAETFDTDGGQSDVIVSGLNIQTITLEGCVFVAGYTNTQLEGTYLAPIRALRGQSVPVTSPNSQYDGTYVVAVVQFRRTLDAGVSYDYLIKLLKGAHHFINI